MSIIDRIQLGQERAGAPLGNLADLRGSVNDDHHIDLDVYIRR